MSEWNWKPHLKQDEKIEWQGQPQLEVNKTVKKLPKYLFFWGAIAILIAAIWPIPGYETIAWIVLGLLAFGMIATGIYLAIKAPNTLRNAHYAITNKRALIDVAGSLNDIELNKKLEVKTRPKGDLKTIEFRNAKGHEENHITKYPEMAYLKAADADKIVSLIGAQSK